MTNSDTIRSLYAAFGRGEIERILDSLDPAIEWESNGDETRIPWGGRRSGVAGAASFFKSLAASLDFELFEPREFFEAGDVVTVIGRTRARYKKNGGVFESEWAHIFTISNGRPTRFREFYDTAAIIGAIAT